MREIQAPGSPRNKKAAGPHIMRKEHLEYVVVLASGCTAVFNKCLYTHRFSAQWKNGTLLVVAEGKGDPAVPSSWRRAAKKRVCYKLLFGLLAKRLESYLENVHIILTTRHKF